MEWYVVQESQSGREVIGKPYNTREKAEKQMQKLNKHNLSIVGVPNIQSGLVLFKHNTATHIITREGKCLWFYHNINDLDSMADCWSKERIINAFIKGYWDCNVEEYDARFTDNIYQGDEENDIIMDELERENEDVESEGEIEE